MLVTTCYMQVIHISAVASDCGDLNVLLLPSYVDRKNK